MVSFIISLDNSYALANNFFSHLLNSDFVKKSEIIVVLDGVTNQKILNYCSILNETNKNINVYSIKKVGYGKANNFAVEKASGKYLFFINSDIFAQDQCFELMLDKLESNEVDCVQPLLIYPQTNLVQCAGTFFGRYYKEHLFEGNLPDAKVVQIEGKRQALTSALYAMKKSTFIEFNGFDEFYYNKLESFEFSYKLTLAGKICWYLPSAIAWHCRGGGRQQYQFDFRQQEAYFWSRFGQNIEPDINEFIKLQLNKEILAHRYYAISMSQLRTWESLIKEVNITTCNFIDMPWISPGVFNLWDILPYEILTYAKPILLLVENISYLKENLYWFQMRNNHDDIAIDRFANVVNILEYLDLP